MPGIVACFLGLIAVIGYQFHASSEFKKDIIKFESRCTVKGGLTLQAYKTGTSWIGCYKDGIELENEQ